MSQNQYAYAVARIRALEVSLFSASVIEQLAACKDEDSCLRFLADKGWGGADVPLEAEAMLSKELEKTWDTVRDMHVDMKIFDVLSYVNRFHNLKAAVKEACTGKSSADIYYKDTEISGEDMLRIIREKDYQALPEYMRECAAQAADALLHSGDGQLCDVIIDRAALDAIARAGKEAKEEVIRDYARSFVTVTDIKIAVRCAKTGKSPDFIRRAIAPCEGFDTEKLVHAALAGTSAVTEFLQNEGYAEAAEMLKSSPSSFERWCDNCIIRAVRPQKYNPFSAGPLVAYVIARENEIKTVRIILTCRQNGLPDEAIRERIREMYV